MTGVSENGEILDTNPLLEQKFSAFSEEELTDYARNLICEFFGANFSGITTPNIENPLLTGLNISDILRDRESIFREISFDDTNRPSKICRGIENLYLAIRAIESQEIERKSFHFALWRFRILHIWAKILEAPSTQLKEKIDSIIKELDKHFLEDFHPKTLKIEYLLEKADYFLRFFEHGKAKEALEAAIELSGLKLELTGAMGKRTKFQLRSLPQLALNATSTCGETVGNGNTMQKSPSDQEVEDQLPHNCANQDDTLLESVVFDTDTGEKKGKLSTEQVACILAMALVQRSTGAFSADLDTETLSVFVEEVIKHKSCWPLQLRALIERSALEMREKRRVERACAQMESIAKLVDCHGREEAERKSNNRQKLMDFRLPFAFCSFPMPFWSVGNLYAKILISLGCVSEALRLFELLSDWDAVVDCYRRLNQLEKAEHLVRELLERKSDPQYFCILGDITNSAEHYHQAIEVSDDRCARARTALGAYFLRNKHYAEAAKHYQRSVQIQPFQMEAWFNLGFSAMKAEDYGEAVRAYHRCVCLEPQYFEAWNNLAASYVSLDQKSRAQKVLLEALKLNYENARVWENLLLISVDIGDIRQSLLAINRILDLGDKKPVDELPLEILSRKLICALESEEKEEHQVNNAGEENQREALNTLRKTLLETLARVSSRQTLGYKVLKLWARLKRPDESDNENCREMTQWSAYTNLLEKAFRREFEQHSKTADEDAWVSVLESLHHLAKEMAVLWTIQGFTEEKMKIHNRLLTNPVISKAKQLFGNVLENAQQSRLKELFVEISRLL